MKGFVLPSLTALLISGCTYYQQYPIANHKDGVVEISTKEGRTESEFSITARIRTSTELYEADFQTVLKKNIEKTAAQLCPASHQVKQLKFEKIYTLGLVSNENTRIRHRADAEVVCL